MKVDISIVIPTCNSARTLLVTLNSIKCQITNHTYEIIIVDAQSNDDTRIIAKKFKASIINNPHIQPEWAKTIGLQQAKGKICVFIDSDESFTSRKALESRYNAHMKNKLTVVLTGGYELPPKATLLQNYMNIFSDPFSFFMYKVSTDSQFIHRSYVNKYPSMVLTNIILIRLNKKIPAPLLDLSGGTSILTSIGKKYVKKPSNIGELIRNLTLDVLTIGLLLDDRVLHLVTSNFSQYLKKINWRVINNLFHSEIAGAGFANRSIGDPNYFHIKKYLFIPYSLSIVIPYIDSFFLVWKRNVFLSVYHSFFSFYTAIVIIFYSILKYCNQKISLPTYGK